MRLKIRYCAAIILLLLINVATLKAQPTNPCDGQDPDDTTPCEVPLDAWVIFLAIAALSFGVWYLHKNQKRFFVQ